MKASDLTAIYCTRGHLTPPSPTHTTPEGMPASGEHLTTGTERPAEVPGNSTNNNTLEGLPKDTPADGTAGGAGGATAPSFNTSTSHPPTLSTEDLGHTVCVVPTTDKTTYKTGSYGKLPTFSTTGPGRNAFVTTVLCITENWKSCSAITSANLPTLRSVCSFTHSPPAGVPPLNNVGSAPPLTHRTGTPPVAPPVCSPSKPSAKGDDILPATEPLLHCTLITKLTPWYIRDKGE